MATSMVERSVETDCVLFLDLRALASMALAVYLMMVENDGMPRILSRSSLNTKAVVGTFRSSRLIVIFVSLNVSH